MTLRFSYIKLFLCYENFFPQQLCFTKLTFLLLTFFTNIDLCSLIGRLSLFLILSLCTHHYGRLGVRLSINRKMWVLDFNPFFDPNHSLHKPCPFGTELKNFALDFVVGFFFKNCKWWSDFVLEKHKSFINLCFSIHIYFL